MRHVPAVALIAVSLLGSLWLPAIGPVSGAIWMVSLGALISLSALREWNPWSIAAGAAGALAFALVSPLSVVVASALFFLAVFTPRAARAKTSFGTSLIASMAVMGGGGAAAITQSYAQAGPSVLLVAIGVGAVLVGAALLPIVDDKIAFSLRSLAWRSKGTTKHQLLRAVSLRRRHDSMTDGLSRTAKKRVKKAWTTLLKTARLRVEGKRTNHSVLDNRIRQYVKSLQKATRAAAAATDISADMEDAVLAELRLEQEGLSAKASALQEVHGVQN